jgi:hypothetical protein
MAEGDYRSQLPVVSGARGGLPAVAGQPASTQQSDYQQSPQAQPSSAASDGFQTEPPISFVIDPQNVRERIVDYLGAVLARCWIDPNLMEELDKAPHRALRHIGIVLPDEFDLRVERPHRDRPRLVVYECNQERTFKRRICYLQLIMMAGK